MKWSPQQDDALMAVERWRKAGGQQVFRLFGYAGAGKTTLARHIAENAGGDVAFAAFTGKAAHVMRQKGCVGATTIHSLIYRPSRVEEEEGEPSFTIRHDAPAADADLIIIDECSMVDEDLGRDLLTFGKPVLVLGDPAQLPPVKGGGYFTEGEPDFMLTEIHRQAADNPIIRLSMAIREVLAMILAAPEFFYSQFGTMYPSFVSLQFPVEVISKNIFSSCARYFLCLASRVMLCGWWRVTKEKTLHFSSFLVI